ncbi:autotransporter outer membrane beta-barrel domain-containing protein [Aquamicrobium sp. LC103]|uniref:autotransporter family protein n=1 Tax=Aquamicrobium sp. LC103 TaxID=1120658 RepID=UPI000AC99F42|nr:autotransporter outer membrane beta-barrel domain-containing protein [Aquamicrobium sp. LC103]
MKNVKDLSVRRSAVVRLLSGVAVVPPVALAVTLQMEQPAIAGDCTPGPTSVCSGQASGADTMQRFDYNGPVEVTTDPGFELNVTGGDDGIAIFGEGGVTFTDNHAATITTDGYFGLLIENESSGNVSVTSTGSLISTGIIAPGHGGDGIRTYNSGADTSVRIHDTEGTGNGVTVDHQGSGSVRIVSTGQATGHNGNGIYGYVWSGTGMTVEAVNTEGAIEGIFARNGTSGALVVTSTGLAVGTSARGILADNYGTDVSVTAAHTHGGSMGIRVNNRGTGFLEVDSTGTAEGGTTGLHAYGAASSASATINAVDTVGGRWGIYATHNGSGPVTVTSTGTATGHGDDGIFVETGAGSSALNLNANHAQGGENGIKTIHGSTVGTLANTATVTVTGNIQGGTGYGIATESASGVLTNINVAAGSVVESVSGNGISNNDGDSNVEIAALGTVNGRVDLGLGSDTMTLRGDFSGITVLDGGGGGTDVLNLFNAANATHAGSDIVNWTEINLDNSYLTLTDGGVAIGTPDDITTGIFLRNGSTLDTTQDNFSLDGNLSLAAGTRFLASGNGSGTTTISGSVINAGLISAQGGGAGDLLRIDGNYTGNNGTIVLDTELGNDTSATDRLDIAGDSSGTSSVRVINTGGAGAATNEGIELITVGGTSDAVFSLVGDYQVGGVPVVVAGAYSYQLFKGNRTGTETNNWYLRSEFIDPTDPDPVDPEEPLYHPGAPVYEDYPQALLNLNNLSTLQQRVGNRFWLTDGPTSSEGHSGASSTTSGIWARIEGAHNSIDARHATAGTHFDQNIFEVQAGIDGLLLESTAGSLIAGVSAHYTHGTVKTYSAHGDGQISTNGYGLGSALTWYGDNGSYIDGQAQMTWYGSDLSSIAASRTLVSGNDAFGYALSLEAGKRVTIQDGWSVTPQAQLAYSRIDFDSFADSFGVEIGRDNGSSLQGRLGLTLDHESRWQNADGLTNRAHVYGIANVYYEFLDGTKVDVAGDNFHFEKDRLWGGLGAGGTYSWNDDTYSLYAEGLINTSLANVGDSYSLQGKVGFQVKW